MTNAQYAELYERMNLNADRLADLADAADKIMSGRVRYEGVAQVLRMPWWWIGAIHVRESDCSFERHLHNGDSLAGRTVNYPPGRPLGGHPPFTWEASAFDALRLHRLDNLPDWSVGSALARAEQWNGMGYANRGMRSPYVWGATDQQQLGKYVSDHRFDPTVMDRQLGVAAICSMLAGLGVRIV